MKKLNKNTLNIFLTTIVILYLSLLLISYTYYKTGDSKNIKRKGGIESLKYKGKEKEKITLDILPTNYEETLKKYSLNLSQKEISYLLDNGFLPLDDKKHNVEQKRYIRDIDGLEYLDFSSLYKQEGAPIFLSSKAISEYFKNKFEEIKYQRKENITFKRILERGFFYIKFKHLSITNNYLLSFPLHNNELSSYKKHMLKNIVIEDDLENYHYIKEQIENVATLSPEFNSLKDEIELITEYLEIEKSRKKIAKANFVLSNILENIPLIPITDNQEIEFFLVTQNNNLFLTPYIFNRDEIERYNLDLVTDDNFSQEYDIPPLPQASDTVRIPVLMYHHIDFFPTGSSSFKQSLYVTEEIFEKQIAYLTRKNYKSISTEEFYSFLITGKNPTQKIVMITFDDSLLTHYTKAFSILQKYGHKGVFFVPSKVGLISSEKLKEMSENEMDIQSHSATHPNLSLISNRAILHQEIVESKKFLENIINKPVTSFAYPGCVGNIPTFNMVQNSGYTQGFSCGTGIDHEYAKRFILSRRQVLNDMEQFKRILSGY